MPYEMAMTPAQREAFLSDVHVGVLAVNEPNRGPLALPVWYEYVDGVIQISMDGDSRKAELLRAAGRATFVVQDENPPYKYVSVEGPVQVVSAERDVVSIATRYLGPEIGAWYAKENPSTPSTVEVRLTPEHWRTQDFSGAAAALDE
jgi:PPOX class probable F420-dependent enzyme